MEVARMYTRILAAVDGSDHSMHALTRAGVLASLNGAVLTLVHVTPDSPVPDNLLTYARGADLSQSATELWPVVARQILQRGREHVVSTVARPPDILEDQRYGDPANGLIEAAEELKAELVVVGSRGLTRFSGLVMGSVSQKLAAAETETDVLIVR
jgi:nucleotide-binding universal stress UspA family protein